MVLIHVMVLTPYIYIYIEGVAEIVFRFGRVPECDLSVTTVARKSKPITS